MGIKRVAAHANGLDRNALGVECRMGFIASSDHHSTRASYACLIVPDRWTTREAVVEILRQRRAFDPADNIVVDFHASRARQGSVIYATQSPPSCEISVAGTAPILSLEGIKNNRLAYSRSGQGTTEFCIEYRDTQLADASMSGTPVVTDWSLPETEVRPRSDP